MQISENKSWLQRPSLEFPKGNQAALVFEHKIVPLRVLFSKSEMKNGDLWFHISVSRPDRIPTWEELTKVKNEFLGEDSEAFHIIPKKEDYVNVHAHCLHIWSPLKTETQLPNLQNLKWESAL